MSTYERSADAPELSANEKPRETGPAGQQVSPGRHGQSSVGAADEPFRANFVIPVGQEPPSQPPIGGMAEAGSPTMNGEGLVAAVSVSASIHGLRGRKKQEIRNPDGLKRHKNALREQQEFVRLTMRDLRRAEITVWMAIHGCKGRDIARIGYAKIKEIAGISSQRHVSEAIRSLVDRGLLEVVHRGRYRPNGDGGMASEYRVFPTSEPRLLEAAKRAEADRADGTVGQAKPR